MRRAALLGAAGRRWQASQGGGGGTPAGLLVGWSMPDGDKTVPGVENEILGWWTARSTWTEVSEVLYLADTNLPDYTATYPDRSVDIGLPLIPHDASFDGSTWNADLDAVIAGSHDAHHQAQGQNLAPLCPATVYVRPWWEFDMGGDLVAGGTPDLNKFKAAWQRAIPNIRSGFAAAARPGQVLKINYSPLPDRDDWADAYPGNGYVDVISPDIYGKVWNNTDPTEAQMLAEITGYLNNLVAFGTAHGKPIAISEWGNVAPKNPSTEYDIRGRGDCPNYIDLMFNWAITNNALYLCYYNSTGGGVAADLDTTPNSKAQFTARAQAIQAPTAPNTPTIGTATAGFYSAVVPFTKASSGARVASFTATSSPGGFTGTAAISPITVSGLTSGQAYTFTVHATNAAGNSAESASSNSVTVLTPTVYAADNFNRANGAVGSTPTGGFAWTAIGASGAASWTINSNRLRGIDGGQHVYVVNTGQANGTVQITRDSGNTHDRLVFRCVDTNNYWTWDPSPYDGYYHLSKKVAGNWTDLGIGPTGQVVTGSQTLTVILNGSRIIGKVNGVTIIDVTDTALSTATRHGVGTDGLSSPPNLFDDFSHNSATA